MKNKTVTISKQEYDLLTKIAFLESDNMMAKKYEGFKIEMNVDIKSNEKDIEVLVNQWEMME